MGKSKPLSRRTFLRSSSGIIVGLPFLEAMFTKAYAQSIPKRFVTTYYGSCTGGVRLTNPSSYGNLTDPLKASFASLEGLKQYLSIVSNIDLPTYFSGSTPEPGSATTKQHGGVESPLFSGCTAVEKTAPKVRGTSADQLAADFLGQGSKMASLQLRVQAAKYNGTTGSRAQSDSISVRQAGGSLSELIPIESPQKVYQMLFSDFTNPGTPTPTISKNKSALDFVLADANRLLNSLGSADRVRLEYHFEKIRELERSLASGTPSGGGGTCQKPSDPGPDPSISTYSFGGWANETRRGEQMADMIAYALACDMVRSVSWAYTHDQSWMNSNKTSGSTIANSQGGLPDVHNDSHFASEDIKAKNCNWAAALFARLISNLAGMSEGSGSVLDSTLLNFITAEGPSAHAKSNYTYLIAGMPSRVNLGKHINGNKAHAGLIQLEALRAIGMNLNKFGEISGSIPGLLK